MRNTWLSVSGYTLGSVAYAFSQWLILTIIIRSGSLADAGEFSYYLALFSPLTILCSFGLRNAVASDATKKHQLHDYLWALYAGGALLTLLYFTILAMADGSHFIITLVFLIKLTDMLSEITYGVWVRDKVSYRYGISKIAQVLLFIALLIAGKWLTVADEIIFMAMPLTILLVFFVYDYPSLSLKRERVQFQFTAVLSIIKESLPLAISALLVSINAYFPRLMLGYVDSSKALLGAFVLVIYFASVAQMPIAALTTVLIPHFRGVSYLELFSQRYFALVLLYGVAYLIFILWFSHFFIKLLYGVEHDFAFHQLFFAGMAGLLLFITLYLNSWFVANRLFRCSLQIAVVTLAFTLVNAGLFITYWGLDGAFFSLFISGLFNVAVNCIVGLRKRPHVEPLRSPL